MPRRLTAATRRARRPGVSDPAAGVSDRATDSALRGLADSGLRAALAESRTPRPRTSSSFHAGGREAEIEEVFRRILAAGAPLDQVEIACASDAHVALVWEKALRHEWAVTLGPGIPAPSTRPGRALIGLCDWIETDFSAGHLRRLLQSGDMGIEEEDEGFTAGQAARTLARAEAGWGRATYALALGRLRKSYEARADDPDLSDDDREAAQEEGGADGTDRWRGSRGSIDAIPEPSPRRQGPAAGRRRRRARVPRALDRARRAQLDHRAASALIDHVDGAARARRVRVLAAARRCASSASASQSLQVAPERPRPGHLYACRLQQAGYSGRPHLFVVGLEEGRVFPAATEDPVLLDAERDGDLARAAAVDRPDRRSGVRRPSRLATWGAACRDVAVERSASREPATVTFSYSCRDTRSSARPMRRG